jgi:uncharacterized protein YlaI
MAFCGLIDGRVQLVRDCIIAITDEDVFDAMPKTAKPRFRPSSDGGISGFIRQVKGEQLVSQVVEFRECSYEAVESFLCQSCGEAVQIPSDQIGKKVHWKCMICHQENHLDSDYQG